MELVYPDAEWRATKFLHADECEHDPTVNSSSAAHPLAELTFVDSETQGKAENTAFCAFARFHKRL